MTPVLGFTIGLSSLEGAQELVSVIALELRWVPQTNTVAVTPGD